MLVRLALLAGFGSKMVNSRYVLEQLQQALG